ncbi:FAST kinase domain-containing protein 1, mitochondrial [Ictalurus furcatus]|uniref:FAST kinase domain-containing protein 1, mitochondrial n=1 Tax=Ictalurus furcatus TaxID=66913 RepID=UPI00234FD0F8|nr:FAST kinase domain-containing protein 1, mitochondrial [Ictalurus furcatus]XP_053483247.1 FAST kinase domain-containing protein 1, mitochondrial [Ictalurus furcatus]
MLRLRSVRCDFQRLFHHGTVCQDHVLGQLRACTAEDQLFDVVSKNKAKLTVSHVGFAVGLLWQFQRERPEMLRTVELIRAHPQFLTLRVLAENKISLMDDATVVDILYGGLRLQIEPHDSLIQQLVTEAWNRLERFPMTTLSKLSICLNDLGLHHSPLMGHITEIVNQRLDSIEDARVLTTLMISISSLISAHLRDALIDKAAVLLDSMDTFHYNNPRRVVQFLRHTKCIHRPLLEKCSCILRKNVPNLDVENLSIIVTLYQSLPFSTWDFRQAAMLRLVELMDSCTDPESFTKLFIALGPLAGPATRERLESTALQLADQLNSHQALVIAETLEERQSRNFQLINKIASVLHRNLEVYRPVEIAKIIQALILLHCQSPELFSRLRSIVLHYLQTCVHIYEVIMLTRVLAMLPSARIEESVFSRIDAMLPQCSLVGLSSVTTAVAKWMRNDPSYRQSTHSKYVRLLQNLNRCAHERVHAANRLDVLMEELKFMSGEWFEEMLLEETIVVLQRLAGQLTWINMLDLVLFLTRTTYRSTPLLDRIADVALENTNKIHYSAVYLTLLPFGVLNYDSPKVDELFDAYIQHFTPKISSFDPHMLVLLAYVLALTNRFPEPLIREIFRVDFLAKLDAQLETLSSAQNLRVRSRLMQLNRAVCLECPEFQVPWFHERYCMQLHRRDHRSVHLAQQEIHRMLGEVLGGINCVKLAVLTPYFYTVDYECVLDRNQQAVPYSKLSELQINEEGKVHWDSGSENERTELPPGAKRIALDFLNSKSFCKNSQHIKGDVQMRKRHLEILGYHVLQIPHFEWNSMELSTPDAWKEYLRKKLFTEVT